MNLGTDEEGATWTIETRAISDPAVTAHLNATQSTTDRFARQVWLSHLSRRRGQRMRAVPKPSPAGWYIVRRGVRHYLTRCEVSARNGVLAVFTFEFD